MNYKFNVNITDSDYLDFHKFWITKSHYGKKQMTTFKLVIALIFCVYIVFSLYNSAFSLDSFLGILPIIILLIIFELAFTPLFVLFLKSHLKGLKKKGKMGYSPSSVLEFYEDKFTEMTDENKAELKYTAVERISVLKDKVIYIHVNNVTAYILPIKSFESEEQYSSFLEFIKTKCSNIDIY